jgi:putative ABC transport system permease protein
MWKVSLKGLWAHKRRLVGTCAAVLLGVAFLAGTLTLTDTMRASFDDAFAQGNAGTAALVRGADTMGTELTAQRSTVDASLVGELATVDGVAAAVPSVEGIAQLVGEDGQLLGGDGPPTLAGNWIDEPTLTPTRLAEGRAPEAAGEVVVDRRTADQGGLVLGSTTVALTPDPVDVTVVGIATFGETDGLPVTYTAFTLEQAQEVLLGAPDQLSAVLLAAEPGVSQAELATRVGQVLPPGAEVLTGQALTDEQVADIGADFLDFFEIFLLAFTGIALLVATFSIYNTFTVILAQRTRESALLRALGASRAQVLRAVGLEALAVGVVASVLGLGAGVLLALGLKTAMDAAGFALPGGLVLDGASMAIALAIGIVVTLLASALPAARASRVPPLAALREVSIDRAGSSVARGVLGALLAVGGVAVIVAAGSVDSNALALAGLGALLTVVGVVVLGPVVAGPAGRLAGAPLAKLRGISGLLARENATRNPKRTASTASALMIGVAVVSLFSVLGASITASIDETVDETFGGDLVISADGFSGSGLSTDLATQVAELPEVSQVAGLGPGVAVVDGTERSFLTTDPAQLDALLDLGVADGSMADLTGDELAVSTDLADEQGWAVGTVVPVTFPDGATTDLTVGATYETTEIVGPMVLPAATWAQHSARTFDVAVMVGLADGVSMDDGRAAVATVAEAFHAPEPQDRDQYVDSVAGEVDQMLSIVYVLLALSILIAVMGIANTLSLSVHERTRELGLLRAVGQTRGQLRSMVRWESVIIALFGTVGGVALGTFLGWGLLRATLAQEGLGAFALPTTQIVVVLVLGAVVGILAGARPARRASRLDVLAAIATD